MARWEDISLGLTRVRQLFLGTGLGVEMTATAAELNQLDASAVGAQVKLKKLPIPIVAAATEQDTGWDLPAKCVVLDAWLDVTTLEATGGTKTVDLGTDGAGSNDPDGFLDGASVAAAGIIKGTLASGGQTKGLLLAVDESGAGVLVPEGDVSSGGESVTYTLGSDDFAELVCNAFILYIEIV